jgi:hypothetical protein
LEEGIGKNVPRALGCPKKDGARGNAEFYSWEASVLIM